MEKQLLLDELFPSNIKVPDTVHVDVLAFLDTEGHPIASQQIVDTTRNILFEYSLINKDIKTECIVKNIDVSSHMYEYGNKALIIVASGNKDKIEQVVNKVTIQSKKIIEFGFVE